MKIVQVACIEAPETLSQLASFVDFILTVRLRFLSMIEHTLYGWFWMREGNDVGAEAEEFRHSAMPMTVASTGVDAVE